MAEAGDTDPGSLARRLNLTIPRYLLHQIIYNFLGDEKLMR
jgi:hypothetical protein